MGGEQTVKLAILVGGIEYDSQKRLISGILRRSVPDGSDVYIFVCDTQFAGAVYQYENGELVIYDLPDLETFDAIVVNLDTICDSIRDTLIDRIRASGRPCVSVSRRIDGFHCVNMDNAYALSAITEHLYSEHGARRFFYIGGSVDNVDSAERLATVRSTLEKLGVSLADSDVTNGYYSYNSGYKETLDMLRSRSRDELPDAIIAANDEMAVGAVNCLRDNGLRVPEDVMVTGYDNAEIGLFCQPRLTTVVRDEEYAGELAYDTLRALCSGESVPEFQNVSGHALFSCSCGCPANEAEAPSLDAFREHILSDHINGNNRNSGLKYFLAESTGVSTFDQLLESLKRFVGKLSPQYFCLAINETPDDYREELNVVASGGKPARDRRKYSDTISAPLIFTNGGFTSYGAFPRRELLPPEGQGRDGGNYYYILPLHHQTTCFGYAVYGNFENALDDAFMRLFTLTVSGMLETVHRQNLVDIMLSRLEHLSTVDELTGVYNRTGFRRLAPRVLAEAAAKSQPVTLFFADIDKLKHINDSYGHETGDICIRAVAQALEEVRRHGELLVRFGGDEFIILAAGYSDEAARSYVERINRVVAESTAGIGLDAPLSISVGFATREGVSEDDLDQIIELADSNMYIVKNASRAKN